MGDIGSRAMVGPDDLEGFSNLNDSMKYRSLLSPIMSYEHLNATDDPLMF